MMLKLTKISLATIILLFTLPTQIASAPIHVDAVIPVVPEVPAILKKISKCESQDRQFNADGSIHRGEINPKDIGKYQINERWNGEEAKRLGFDIYTLEGNTKMALWLYKTRGTQPWNWSKNCWGK